MHPDSFVCHSLSLMSVLHVSLLPQRFGRAFPNILLFQMNGNARHGMYLLPWHRVKALIDPRIF